MRQIERDSGKNMVTLLMNIRCLFIRIFDELPEKGPILVYKNEHVTCAIIWMRKLYAFAPG